jgi:hypothetical protein
MVGREGHWAGAKRDNDAAPMLIQAVSRSLRFKARSTRSSTCRSILARKTLGTPTVQEDGHSVANSSGEAVLPLWRVLRTSFPSTLVSSSEPTEVSLRRFGQRVRDRLKWRKLSGVAPQTSRLWRGLPLARLSVYPGCNRPNSGRRGPSVQRRRSVCGSRGLAALSFGVAFRGETHNRPDHSFKRV